MFCQKEKSMERLPATQDALMQHTKRAVYQAGIWCTSDQIEQHVPSPEYWPWEWTLAEDTWIPVWTKLPIAARVCSELIKCGCKSKNRCGSRCACKKAGWNCCELCSCFCEKIGWLSYLMKFSAVIDACIGILYTIFKYIYANSMWL